MWLLSFSETVEECENLTVKTEMRRFRALSKEDSVCNADTKAAECQAKKKDSLK